MALRALKEKHAKEMNVLLRDKQVPAPCLKTNGQKSEFKLRKMEGEFDKARRQLRQKEELLAATTRDRRRIARPLKPNQSLAFSSC